MTDVSLVPGSERTRPVASLGEQYDGAPEGGPCTNLSTYLSTRKRERERKEKKKRKKKDLQIKLRK